MWLDLQKLVLSLVQFFVTNTDTPSFTAKIFLAHWQSKQVALVLDGQVEGCLWCDEDLCPFIIILPYVRKLLRGKNIATDISLTKV